MSFVLVSGPTQSRRPEKNGSDRSMTPNEPTGNDPRTDSDAPSDQETTAEQARNAVSAVLDSLPPEVITQTERDRLTLVESFLSELADARAQYPESDRAEQAIQSEVNGNGSMLLRHQFQTHGIVDGQQVDRTGTVCAKFKVEYLRKMLTLCAENGDSMLTVELGHDTPILFHGDRLSYAVAPRIYGDHTETDCAAEEAPGYTDPLPTETDSDPDPHAGEGEE